MNPLTLNEPRSVESWSFYTVRASIAVKFGTSRKSIPAKTIVEPVTAIPVILEKEVQFSVRAPKVVPLSRQVKETFPLINSIFFNQESTEIPARYILLVTVFGIDGSRISIDGRDKPTISSEQPGAEKELALLREEDRRVDIVSTSPELLMQVGGSTSAYLKPVEITSTEADPLDSYVLFNTDGAAESLKSWSVDVTDEQGNVQHYGPYTGDQAAVSGKTILGNSQQGNYKITMLGQTKNGNSVQKESSVSLMKMDDPKQQGLLYSTLFNFDQSKSIASYENFLTDMKRNAFCSGF